VNAHDTGSAASSQRRPYGLLIEFESVPALLRAAERVRDEGYTRWDVHSPFPVHGLDDAMGIRPTRLPWVVLGAGLTGAGAALLLQWWTNAVDFPFLISGKPFFSLPADIPIVFELTVLFAALTAFIGMLAFNGLPSLYHALFRNRRFRQVTNDRFFISIESADPRYDSERTRSFAWSLGPSHVEELDD
jgi:hypothetical protein